MKITPETTRIGWIGTGVMGNSMCMHLIDAGYKATVVYIFYNNSLIVLLVNVIN